MIFTFEERPDSRGGSMNPPSQTRIYKAVGEQDDAIVRAYALAGVPNAVFTDQGTLYKQDIRVEPDGFAQYVVTVPYGPRQKQTGAFTWNFDTTGATVKIKCAKEHVETYYPPSESGDGNPHDGLIGVNGEDVEGADIVIPAMKLSYDFQHPQGVVDEALARTLYRATGKTNSDVFRGFAAGELLYLGSTGSDGSESEAKVTYNFAASENVTDLSFGNIVDIVKLGHHYAWVEWKPKDDSGGSAAMTPKRVHVERVYNPLNFAATFGWS